jgi:hypothetical protein
LVGHTVSDDGSIRGMSKSSNVVLRVWHFGNARRDSLTNVQRIIEHRSMAVLY